MQNFIRYRWLWFGLMILIMAPLLKWIGPALIPDNSLSVWFLKTDPLLVSYHEFHEHFGNDEVILTVLEEENGIFNQATLLKLQAMSEKIKAIDGVDRITSILTVQDAFDTPGGIRFEKLVPSPIPSDPAELQAIETRARNNILIEDRFVSKDGKKAMISIQMTTGNFDAIRDRVVAEVKQVIDEDLKDTPHPIGGLGVIYSALNILTQQDFGTFLSLCYLFMFSAMWWVFRSARLLIGGMGVILYGCLFTLSIYGLAGRQLNMVTAALPTLIIVLGIGDAIHFPSTFIHLRHEYPNLTRPQIVEKGLRQVFMPCVLTSMTTIAGFLSLVTSPMSVIKDMGIYAAIGLVGTLAASMVFMTIAFLSLPENVRLPRPKWMGTVLNWCEQAVILHPWKVLSAFVVVALLSFGGASMVKVDTYTIGYLPKSDRAVVDHHDLEQRWGYYNVMEFLIKPKGSLRADSPEILNGMESFIDEVKQFSQIRDGSSQHLVYRRLETVFRGTEPPPGPMSPELIAQMRMIIGVDSMSWDKSEEAYDDNFVAPFMMEDGSLGRVTLIGAMMSASEVSELIGKVQLIAQRHLGAYAEVVSSGYVPMYVTIIDYVMRSQINSFFLALGLIFLMMLLWLRSFRLALLSLIPNVYPVLVMMGCMGAAGIDLDVTTAIIAAIVIGVAIDDTIHFLYHWNEAEKAHKTWEQALKWTFDHTGRAAITTTVLLMIGYPVMMFASVKSVVYFGFLTTIAALTALLADLLLTPLMMRLWPPKSVTSK
ncbi:MAG: MMPL family transporter [SAR324 cluster bacterium]|nr:MMPL family transporter [SAR324 cluster bacterium]